jgi:hypothetical protein
MPLYNVDVRWHDGVRNHSAGCVVIAGVEAPDIDTAQYRAVSIVMHDHQADLGYLPTNNTYSVLHAEQVEETMPNDDYKPFQPPAPPAPVVPEHTPTHGGYTAYTETPEPTSEPWGYDEWDGDDEDSWDDTPTEEFEPGHTPWNSTTAAAAPVATAITSLTGVIVSKLTALANGYVPYIKAHFFV